MEKLFFSAFAETSLILDMFHVSRNHNELTISSVRENILERLFSWHNVFLFKFVGLRVKVTFTGVLEVLPVQDCYCTRRKAWLQSMGFSSDLSCCISVCITDSVCKPASLAILTDPKEGLLESPGV